MRIYRVKVTIGTTGDLKHYKWTTNKDATTTIQADADGEGDESTVDEYNLESINKTGILKFLNEHCNGYER